MEADNWPTSHRRHWISGRQQGQKKYTCSCRSRKSWRVYVPWCKTEAAWLLLHTLWAFCLANRLCWTPGKLSELHQTWTNKDWTCWIWPNILKQTPTATTHRTNICVCRSLFDRCAIGFNNTQQTSHLFPLMYSFQMKAELSDIKEVCNWKWEQLSFLQQCSLMSSSIQICCLN